MTDTYDTSTIEETFEHLDNIFGDVDASIATPSLVTSDDVTVFAPAAGNGALYIGGRLVGTGDVESLYLDALIHLGAHIVSSDEHRLGRGSEAVADNLDQIAEYADTVDHIDALRTRAAALLAEAEALTNG
jgi:hypothetical protein